MTRRRRLIEVAFPLEEVSAHSRREKNVRHGHISTLHIWWARRPLAACTGVLMLYYTEWQTAHRMREEFFIYMVDHALSDPRLWIIQHPVGRGIEVVEKVVEYQIGGDQLRAIAEPGGLEDDS